MTQKQTTKLIREGQYVAEVDVELLYTAGGWSPYMSLDDAQKLDNLREALRQSDIEVATQLARVFKLIPVAA